MSKLKMNIRELVESHTPTNFKYYINLKREEDLKALETLGYDLDNLNTIRQPDLIKRAIAATYKYYEREVVAHAKRPTIMENGVILNKKMATKTVLSGQPEDENNYEVQPIAPQKETFKAKKKFTMELAPYSFVMLEYSL